jgi:hypothetical protein
METFRQAYHHELASEALVLRWERIDYAVALLVALTASSSVVAGWALWNTPGGQVFWAAIAGVASVASIVHGVLRVPGRVKDQENLRRLFSGLRVDLQTFQQHLAIDHEENATKMETDKERGSERERRRDKEKEFDQLRKRLADYTARAPAIPERLRKKVSLQLDLLLTGFVDDRTGQALRQATGLRGWMDGHNLKEIPVQQFMTGSIFSELRKKAVAELNISGH